jgi:S-methylmethionine-dependent homocysteine/selenocysteine methylase
MAEAGIPATINQDALSFIRGLASQWDLPTSPIAVGALVAPKNDCYLPQLALHREEAAAFHSWQIDRLVYQKPEVIIAQTMPAMSEALGIADLLADSEIPYIISFVVDNDCTVLDGTPLQNAIAILDQVKPSPPLAYMVNCVYPTTLLNQKDSTIFKRLIGIQANASSKALSELDGADVLLQDPLEEWGRVMLELHQRMGLKILGGCCGTDDQHLTFIAENITS